MNGVEWKQSADIELPKEDTTNPEIERMWAWHRIDGLLKTSERTGAREQVIPEIVRLGEEFSIVTEYTSFLVLENDAEFQRWKIERRNAARLARDRQSQAARETALTALAAESGRGSRPAARVRRSETAASTSSVRRAAAGKRAHRADSSKPHDSQSEPRLQPGRRRRRLGSCRPAVRRFQRIAGAVSNAVRRPPEGSRMHENAMITSTLTPITARGPIPRAADAMLRVEVLIFALLLVLLNLALFTDRSTAALAFRADAVAAGEWWRLLTHPFVHVSWYHLFLDGAAFLSLYANLLAEKRWRRLVFAAASAAGSLLAALWASPLIADHGLCGLSGAAHGLMAVSALELLADPQASRNIRAVALASFVAVTAKSIFELVTGHASSPPCTSVSSARQLSPATREACWVE